MKAFFGDGDGDAVSCGDCIAFDLKGALTQVATREEIMETLAMSIYFGAGPSAIYASHAIDACVSLAQTASPPTN